MPTPTEGVAASARILKRLPEAGRAVAVLMSCWVLAGDGSGRVARSAAERDGGGS
jgi:hypothetical protein